MTIISAPGFYELGFEAAAESLVEQIQKNTTSPRVRFGRASHRAGRRYPDQLYHGLRELLIMRSSTPGEKHPGFHPAPGRAIGVGGGPG